MAAEARRLGLAFSSKDPFHLLQTPFALIRRSRRTFREIDNVLWGRWEPRGPRLRLRVPGDRRRVATVHRRLPQTPPGNGSENQADDGEQRWDRQSEAVPERRLDWEQPKLQQGSRALAGPQ
jgi:hypothetical protein